MPKAPVLCCHVVCPEKAKAIATQVFRVKYNYNEYNSIVKINKVNMSLMLVISWKQALFHMFSTEPRKSTIYFGVSLWFARNLYIK